MPCRPMPLLVPFGATGRGKGDTFSAPEDGAWGAARAATGFTICSRAAHARRGPSAADDNDDDDDGD